MYEPMLCRKFPIQFSCSNKVHFSIQTGCDPISRFSLYPMSTCTFMNFLWNLRITIFVPVIYSKYRLYLGNPIYHVQRFPYIIFGIICIFHLIFALVYIWNILPNRAYFEWADDTNTIYVISQIYPILRQSRWQPLISTEKK